MSALRDDGVCALVSTTQRCGSSWVASICCKIIDQNRRAAYVGGLAQRLLDFAHYGNGDDCKVEGFSKAILEAGHRGDERIFKTHDLPPRLVPLFLEQNPGFLAINVIRDFRDILISRLMYNRYYLPTVGIPVECRFVADHAHLSDVEMVRRFYGTPEMLEWLANWKLFDEPVNHERYISLRYEALLDVGELKRTIELLGQKLVPGGLSRERIEEIAAGSQFQEIDINLKRDRKQREVKTDFCRKGVAGDFERFLLKYQSATLKLLMG